MVCGVCHIDVARSVHSHALRILKPRGASGPYVINLTGTGGGLRLNGNYFLTTNGPGATVFDDNAEDVLSGRRGLDWFFANLDLGVVDRIIRWRPGEFLEDED